MRLVYLSSILLTITVCSIASNNAAPTNEDKPANVLVATTAVPPKPANAAKPDSEAQASVDTSGINSTTPVTTSISVGKVSSTIKIDTNKVTTPFAINITTKSAPTVPPTTKETPTTTEKPTEKTTEKPKTSSVEPSTTSSQTTVSPSVTTAIPVSTKVAPPHKERQFDGLSFVGGIILTISLVAIGTFSYKFYRTLNDRNYRTL